MRKITLYLTVQIEQGLGTSFFVSAKTVSKQYQIRSILVALLFPVTKCAVDRLLCSHTPLFHVTRFFLVFPLSFSIDFPGRIFAPFPSTA